MSHAALNPWRATRLRHSQGISRSGSSRRQGLASAGRFGRATIVRSTSGMGAPDRRAQGCNRRMAEIPSNDPSCDVAKRIVDTFDERVTAFAEWVWASPARTWDDIVSRALIAAEESEFDPQASLSATSADIQTALRECAYATAFQTSEQRKAELPIWLHRYNWHRPHASLGKKPPISRIRVNANNLLQLHS